MPTSETQLNKNAGIDRLGIIAGGGDIPGKLARSCAKNGIEVFIIAFEGQTKPETVHGFPHIWTHLGAAGHIIKTLKSHNIEDITLIGGIRRPSFSELKPDLKGAEIIARLGLKSFGDNDLLCALKAEFQKVDIQVHGIETFMNNLLCPAGRIGAYAHSKKQIESIRRGIEASRIIGQLDIGQSVIVQQGLIIGVEGIEGTDELIKRCKGYLRKGGGAILVKTCKPNQDKSLDLPTIGPSSVIVAAENGLAGIIIEAHNSILIESERVAQLANKYKLFVEGIILEDFVRL